MASLMEGWMDPRFRFEQLFCIAVMALTPASLVAIGYAALGLWQGWLSFIYLVVFAFYFTSAAAVCRPLLGPAEEREF
jgi:MFS-type transporter involved in bile tolerance (Atg22 family)